ncbi:MAG TPA: hypothetical protein VJC39_01385 [Candidatus Nanoarchaeia archaeon]|nr:hypothetical protein [Candidatus Nanoarchaeia archaeon]
MVSIGIKINTARVTPTAEGRVLEVIISSSNMLDYAGIKSIKSQSEELVASQLNLAQLGQSYAIATPKDPLRGYGVGILPFWGKYFLMAGKGTPRNFKITPISGFPDLDLSVSYVPIEIPTEIRFPFIGALREFFEEVGLRKENLLQFIAVKGIENICEGGYEEIIPFIYAQVLKQKPAENRDRLELYRSLLSITNLSSEEAVLKFNLVNSLEETFGIKKDTIILRDEEGNTLSRSHGFFYWDPPTAGVNIIYLAELHTDAIPFSSEFIYGTERLDPNSYLVAIEPEKILALSDPQELEVMLYTSTGSGITKVKTVPGGFNLALAELA